MSNLAFQVQPKRQQQHRPDIKPKVKKKKHITIGEKILFSLLLVLSIIGCIMIVSNQATIYQINNDIHTLETNITKQQKVNSGLEEEITELSRPERILKIATEQGLTIFNNNVKVIGD